MSYMHDFTMKTIKREKVDFIVPERNGGMRMSNKTADEMFEKLGYKKKDLNFVFSRFWEEWENEELAKTFSFNTEYQTIDITDENEYGIIMQELQAINKKCEELGWI